MTLAIVTYYCYYDKWYSHECK